MYDLISAFNKLHPDLKQHLKDVGFNGTFETLIRSQIVILNDRLANLSVNESLPATYLSLTERKVAYQDIVNLLKHIQQIYAPNETPAKTKLKQEI